MKSMHATRAVLIIAATILGGCASTAPQQTSAPYMAPRHANASNYGVIDSIEMVTHQTDNRIGAGAVVGGVVGGLLGNQVGGGSGKTLATVAGVVGGAVVGNNIQQNQRAPATYTYQIRVHLDNGSNTTIAQTSMNNLQVGDRVQIVDGRVLRN